MSHSHTRRIVKVNVCDWGADSMQVRVFPLFFRFAGDSLQAVGWLPSGKLLAAVFLWTVLVQRSHTLRLREVEFRLNACRSLIHNSVIIPSGCPGGFEAARRFVIIHFRHARVGEPVAMLASTRFQFAVSQLTTLRWDLPEELCHCVEHGFDAISLWRAKVSDVGIGTARELLQQAGVRVSSLHWAGGFTGSDGQTFDESLADCHEAIETAEQLACPVLTVYAGCRGGHTLSHARRLVRQALAELAPAAASAGVTLALKPVRPLEAPGCGFMASLEATQALLADVNHEYVGLALDLWSFADDSFLMRSWDLLVRHIRLVMMADRNGPFDCEQDRLLPGAGRLPLDRCLRALVDAGYQGDIEIDPVGETVMQAGYEATLAAMGQYRDELGRMLRRPQPRRRAVAMLPVLAEAAIRLGHP